MVGNPEVIQVDAEQISTGKSTSLQQLVGHCWRVSTNLDERDHSAPIVGTPLLTPVGRFILSALQHIASARPVSDYFLCGIHKEEEAAPDGRSRGD